MIFQNPCRRPRYADMPKRRRSDFRRRFGRADRCKNTSRTERCATCMRSSAISLSPIRGAHHRRLVFLRSVQAAMRSEGRVRQGRRAHRGCGCFGRFPPVGRARAPWVFQTLSAWRRGTGRRPFRRFSPGDACARRGPCLGGDSAGASRRGRGFGWRSACAQSIPGTMGAGREQLDWISRNSRRALLCMICSMVSRT